MINNLKENQIFIFGSNTNGNHSGGAAKQAKEQFGAIEGQGEGLQGQSYAFPTLDAQMEQQSLLELEKSRDLLFKTAEYLSGNEFLLTKVGCGIAGIEELYMKSLFTNHPVNLVLPEDWE